MLTYAHPFKKFRMRAAQPCLWRHPEVFASRLDSAGAGPFLPGEWGRAWRGYASTFMERASNTLG